MTAPSHASSDWHRVGAGLSVRFSLSPAGVDAEWTPRCPRDKTEFFSVRAAYRVARNAYLTEIAKRMGRPLICLEV